MKRASLSMVLVTLCLSSVPVANAGLLSTLKAKASSSWDGVKDHFKEAGHEVWTGLKTMNCGKIVEGMSKINVANIIAGAVWKPAGECVTKFQEGFICSVPDLIHGVADLVIGTGKAGWENKKICLPMGPLFPVCGLYYFGKAKIEKMAKCFKAMSGKEVLKLLWAEAWKLGCKIVGELTADAVLEGLSAGGGTPAVVAKWILKLHHMLSPATWMKIHTAAKSVNAAVDYVKEVSKGLSECQ